MSFEYASLFFHFCELAGEPKKGTPKYFAACVHPQNPDAQADGWAEKERGEGGEGCGRGGGAVPTSITHFKWGTK